MKLERTVEPVNRVVEWAEAQTHLRSPSSSDQTYIETLIDVVTKNVETITGRALITQTWKAYLDDFPSSDEIILPYPNLQSVTSVDYIDSNGDSQTFSSASYQVDTKSVPGKIKLVVGSSWPSTKDQLNAVTVTYIAGYGDDKTDVPADIKHAVLLLVSHLYLNRQEYVFSPMGAAEMVATPRAAASLLANYEIQP